MKQICTLTHPTDAEQRKARFCACDPQTLAVVRRFTGVLQLVDPTLAHWVYKVSVIGRKPSSWQSPLLVCWLLALTALPLRAQSTLLNEEEKAFQQAVKAVSASVVQIETFGGLERVGDEMIAEGPTTGTIVDPDGWIVSSLFSFRQQPASILVTLPSGKRSAARIAARDFSRELVLLKVETVDKLPVAPFAKKSDVAVGQWTVALGKTYDKQSVSQSVGIVSALGRAYDKAIQTDAKVSPINYGGPLVDLSGRVLGILSPISPGTFLEGDSSQLYDSGIGFAIPMEDIVARLPGMKEGKDVSSGKLGVVSSNQNELVGPVRISGTAPGSPAAKVAIKAGDMLVEVGGHPITLFAHLKHALGPRDAGETVAVVVDRKGQRLKFAPTLTESIPVYRRRYLGLRVVEPTKGAAGQGITIAAIEANSPAAASSLAIGETIVRCNGEDIRTTADLVSFIAVAELDAPLELEVLPATEEPKASSKEPAIAPRAVEITATTWPTQLPEQLPKIDARIEESMQTEVVDVVLGDVPNKSFAIIPPLSDARKLGLLVVFPEPGEVDRPKIQAYWSNFCRDYGWIVAVVGSDSPRTWNREEVELAGRVIGRLDKQYQIDKLRTVLAGLGSGGRMALGASLMENQRVSGALAIGTDFTRFGWPRANSPMQSTDFFLVGGEKQLAPVTEKLSGMGYSVNVATTPNLELSKWETFPAQDMQLWLEGLGRL